jgi:hypothetical protein
MGPSCSVPRISRCAPPPSPTLSSETPSPIGPRLRLTSRDASSVQRTLSAGKGTGANGRFCSRLCVEAHDSGYVHRTDGNGYQYPARGEGSADPVSSQTDAVAPIEPPADCGKYQADVRPVVNEPEPLDAVQKALEEAGARKALADRHKGVNLREQVKPVEEMMRDIDPTVPRNMSSIGHEADADNDDYDDLPVEERIALAADQVALQRHPSDVPNRMSPRPPAGNDAAIAALPSDAASPPNRGTLHTADGASPSAPTPPAAATKLPAAPNHKPAAASKSKAPPDRWREHGVLVSFHGVTRAGNVQLANGVLSFEHDAQLEPGLKLLPGTRVEVLIHEYMPARYRILSVNSPTRTYASQAASDGGVEPVRKDNSKQSAVATKTKPEDNLGWWETGTVCHLHAPTRCGRVHISDFGDLNFDQRTLLEPGLVLKQGMRLEVRLLERGRNWVQVAELAKPQTGPVLH